MRYICGGRIIMQNYEELFEALQPLEKALGDAASAVAKYHKSIKKNTDTGNLTEVKKSLDAAAETANLLQERIQTVREAVEGFDTQSYFAEGDFTRQLLDACRDRGIDVRGETGVYEMFPFKVRITGDAEHDGEIWINRKKLPSFRPSYAADLIRAEQQKLYSARFNELSFMTELADAYEIACLKSGSRIGSTQSLDKIYKYLAPTARARKDYDKQAYAFDLARLYEKGTEAWVSKAGNRYFFGTSRDGKSGIRVLSSTGVESFINTIRQIRQDGE